MIAQRAGVATGSVFTTFASKLDILKMVMEDRLERLYVELDHVAKHLRGTTADRLCSIMAVHYDFEMRRPRLYTAFIAAHFEWTEGASVLSFGKNPRMLRILYDILERGVSVGEVRADADLDTFLDVVLSAYGFNYRRAAQDGLDASQLIELMDRQIGMTFRGVASA